MKLKVKINKKILKWILLLSWILIIFIFSSQPYSGSVTKSMVKQILPTVKYTSLIDLINFTIRKLAHLFEYTLLALLTISLLKEYTTKEKIILISSLVFCFLYAITDEFHQSLVPGRSCLFKDVLIDTAGSLIGIIIYLTIKRISFKRNY